MQAPYLCLSTRSLRSDFCFQFRFGLRRENETIFFYILRFSNEKPLRILV